MWWYNQLHSHKQFNASLGKLAAIQHLSPKPASWTGCDGALKAAKEAVRKPVIPWCVIGENYGQAFHMCKRASLISIYCKAFQLVSLVVDWIAQCSQCVARSVWLWPHLSKVAIAKKFERDSSCFLPIFCFCSVFSLSFGKNQRIKSNGYVWK